MKIIDLDLQRRRISLSIKQAAEGGEVAAEYQRALRRARLRRRGQLHRPGHRRHADRATAWAEYYDASRRACADDGAERRPPRAGARRRRADTGAAERAGAPPTAASAGGRASAQLDPTSRPDPGCRRRNLRASPRKTTSDSADGTIRPTRSPSGRCRRGRPGRADPIEERGGCELSPNPDPDRRRGGRRARGVRAVQLRRRHRGPGQRRTPREVDVLVVEAGHPAGHHRRRGRRRRATSTHDEIPTEFRPATAIDDLEHDPTAWSPSPTSPPTRCSSRACSSTQDESQITATPSCSRTATVAITISVDQVRGVAGLSCPATS